MRRHELEHLPSLSPGQRRATRLRREALVTGGLLVARPGDVGVPRHIESSWRRCVDGHVPATPGHIDYRELDDLLPELLRRAAAPVLERLKDSFADVPVAMVLSDASGRIVMRHADVARQRAVMDRASAAEGFDYSEGSVGTNGIGTVLIERRPVLVRGPEHYNTLLEDLTCAGTPIVEPGTGRLVGCFSLACALRDVHPLMSVMTGDIGRQIEARMLEVAGDRRRNLVRAYLSVDGATTGALVVDEQTVLANRPGLVHTGPEVHAVLWRFLDEHGPADVRRMPVPLSDGLHDAVVEPIRDGGGTAYSIRLLPPRPGRRTEERAPVSARSPEPWHVHDDIDRQIGAALRYGETIALTGPGGAGKLHTALATLRRLGCSQPLVLEPHDDPGWFATARAAATQGRGVVLRRVHLTPSPTAAELESVIAAGAPVVLTADLDAAADAVIGAVRSLATTVRLPPLAQYRQHLPALVGAMLAELPHPESTMRLTPAAWDRLTTWHWPGNLAELRRTVTLLARRAEGGTVDLDDLPHELRAPHRSVGMLESAERDAVAEALRSADGNRSRAAQILGVGRTTLYRKMREFGMA